MPYRLALNGLGLCAVVGLMLNPATVATQANPVVTENQLPGTSAWQIPWGSTATDAGGQIKGYASATSVNKGENLTLFVSTNPSQLFSIDVYRIGWYQGLGGRLVHHVDSLFGVQQPACPTDATTGLIECQWASSYTLATDASWTSGLYLARLRNAQNYQNFIMFVVRDDNRVAPLLYQQPVTTYQAYNDYPYNNATGKSLYEFNSYGANTVGGGKGALKVSFDRPYMGDGTSRDWGNSVFNWEIAFIRWMEKSGYDVTYSTNLDTHTAGARLLNYRGFISSGHDEYWSKPMYDAVVAARDSGVHLGFFGANTLYTQVRFESSTLGIPNRVMVCYRNAALDPNADPILETVNWRDAPVNRPEQALLGVQFTNQVLWSPQSDGYAPYVVTNSSNWVYAGTGFVDGNSVPGLVGYEADRWYSGSAQPNAVGGTYTLLSNSPYTTRVNTADQANSSVYQTASGAWVFSAGTIGWSRALDNFNGFNVVDARIQQMTANILDRFTSGGGPPPPPPTTTVSYDNAASSGFQWGVASVTTQSFVIGTGAKRAAMIMVAMSGNAATNITASVGGVSGTVVAGTDSGTTAPMRTVIFQVINPPSGAQTATVSWSNGALNATVGVITVSGADQTAPATNGTFAATSSAPSQSTGILIMSAPGDLTASIGYTVDGWSTPPTNQTLKWGLDGGAVGGAIGSGSGTETHTWTDWYWWQTQVLSGANFKASTTP